MYVEQNCGQDVKDAYNFSDVGNSLFKFRKQAKRNETESNLTISSVVK